MTYFPEGSPEQEMLENMKYVRQKYKLSPIQVLRVLVQLLVYYINL